MTRSWLPAFILTALFLVLGGVPGAAQTPDGQTPAEEVLCNMEQGAAFGLCNAYCEAMDCHLASDGDPDTTPNASAAACERVRNQFTRVTGRELPCEQMVACPCIDPDAWGGPEGLVWRNFALGTFDPSVTTCTDDATLTKLLEVPVEADPSGAAVDAVVPECQVFLGDTGTPVLSLGLAPQEVAACRGLLRAAASNNGVSCTP